ncbi:MAG: sulfatase-like hydrolase/transferase [Pirellulales bacterium]|nr:sulfatase-like hydrolase/transferase [Pirellulales bacterium]
MMQRHRKLLVPLSALLLVVGSASATEPTKPNLILIMCDDLGWGDVGFNGSKVCKTPCLDEMAAGSLKFNRFYSAAPVCSPTRGSAITGRHPYRYGIPFANTGHMKKQEVTLAEALKTQGYATGHFGKWHLGTLTTKMKDANRGRPGNTKDFSPPWNNGFDVCFSTESKVPTWNPLSVPLKFGPGESRRYGWIPVEDANESKHYGTHYWSGQDTTVTDNVEGANSRVIMDRAVPFVEQCAKAKKPFFAIVWFHTPHLPVVAGKKYRDMYADRSKKEQLYYGCITAMDEQVGRLRKTLRSLGIADDTIVCFASDNGPENGTPGSAGHLRGRKRSLYEGGVRVPGLIEWPAKIRAARTTDMPAVTSDYFPTMLDVLGFEMEGQPEPIDGVSLLPLVEGKMLERPRPISFQSQGTRTLSDNRYKLVVTGKKKSRAELYDLVEDPSEKNDLADERPEIVKAMSETLAKWQKSCQASASGADYK